MIRKWQRNIGYVPQTIFLSDDTMAANIAFGIPEEQIDLRAVEAAARTAQLHDFIIEQLPGGYSGRIGEGGVRLSGGQRQRIGLARALYHDPDILVLDEATSALDGPTEQAVMTAISDIEGSKTIIMIAHRLATVRACDQIVMLDKGRVVGCGTYDALLEKNEAFGKLALA
jgi:ABC-type multidrug transport system fused ATPase/permease subunit